MEAKEIKARAEMIRKADTLESSCSYLKHALDINKRLLLNKYSKFLEEHGYMDTDWWCEEPNTIDEFLSELEDK